MTPLIHDSFTLTRDIAASPDRVFSLWATAEAKRPWFGEGKDHALDFRVGGIETGGFDVSDGPGRGRHENVTHYLDIAPDERIVMAYTMAMNGRIHSASLATVSFEAREGGTRLTYTEQMTRIGMSDGPEGRAHGWGVLLDALQGQIERTMA